MIKSIRCFSYPSIGLKSSNTLKFISAFFWALSFFSFLLGGGGGQFNSSRISLSLFSFFTTSMISARFPVDVSP